MPLQLTEENTNAEAFCISFIGVASFPLSALSRPSVPEKWEQLVCLGKLRLLLGSGRAVQHWLRGPLLLLSGKGMDEEDRRSPDVEGARILLAHLSLGSPH